MLDISGEWKGFYAYADRKQSESLDWLSSEFDQVEIEVHFQQSENVVLGQMKDKKSGTQEVDFRRYLNQHRKTFGLKNFLGWQRVLFYRPNIRLLQSNPVEASCNGHIRGTELYFVKTYAGTAKSCYHEDGVEIGSSSETMQPVTYRGEVSPDGLAIIGRWQISAYQLVDGTAVAGVEGIFELKRML